MTDTTQVGRPTKFQPEYCEQAAKLARLGATDLEIADFFGVAESTIYLWKNVHPEFSEAIKRSKDEVDNLVEQSLYRRAMGYTHPEEKVFHQNGEIFTHQTIKHYPPDATSMIFWLKNRRPDEWRDRVEHTGKGGEALFPEINDQELARRVAFVLEKGSQSQGH